MTFLGGKFRSSFKQCIHRKLYFSELTSSSLCPSSSFFCDIGFANDQRLTTNDLFSRLLTTDY